MEKGTERKIFLCVNIKRKWEVFAVKAADLKRKCQKLSTGVFFLSGSPKVSVSIYKMCHEKFSTNELLRVSERKFSHLIL